METVERIITRFSRALDSYDLHADAQQQICRKLTGILSRYTDIHFQRALEIGCGTGGFTRLLKESCVIDEWYLNDICDGCREKVASLFPGQSPLFIAGNAEEIFVTALVSPSAAYTVTVMLEAVYTAPATAGTNTFLYTSDTLLFIVLNILFFIFYLISALSFVHDTSLCRSADTNLHCEQSSYFLLFP